MTATQISTWGITYDPLLAELKAQEALEPRATSDWRMTYCGIQATMTKVRTVDASLTELL